MRSASCRLKYTIEDRGVEWFKEELNQRLGWSLESVRDFPLNQLQTGMVNKDGEEYWSYGLFVEGGRLRGKRSKLLEKLRRK